MQKSFRWLTRAFPISMAVLALPLSGAAQDAGPAEPDSPAPEGLSTTDWSSIRAAYEAGRYGARPVDGGYRFRNPRQRWETVLDDRGFTTRPDGGGWSWGLELVCYGFAGRECTLQSPECTDAAGARVAYDWDDTLREWYVNDRRGLEHG
ncbi:MAG TPA: hypothetical protein VMT18_03355, partial [Planctomycetota bacterium]|nr:hypothetical protein [Planctomycetota bacterium]